jgi:hypothetical protein
VGDRSGSEGPTIKGLTLEERKGLWAKEYGTSVEMRFGVHTKQVLIPT